MTTYSTVLGGAVAALFFKPEHLSERKNSFANQFYKDLFTA